MTEKEIAEIRIKLVDLMFTKGHFTGDPSSDGPRLAALEQYVLNGYQPAKASPPAEKAAV